MSRLIFESSVVEADWLKEHTGHPGLVILDASWFLPGVERDAKKEWRSERIPGAQYFDFDTKICDQNAELAHMLPSADYFAQQVGLLGISNESSILVYDSQGLFSAARVWWMFRAMGHKSVAILNGGLPAWKAIGGPMETTPVQKPSPANFHATFCPEWVVDIQAVHERSQQSETVILDARSADRFYCRQPEPRPHVRSGRIPNSKSFPFAELLDNGFLKPQNELKASFDRVCSDEQSLIFSCGSGVTACILALAASQIGKDKLAVYDGSWSEWGTRSDYPVETS